MRDRRAVFFIIAAVISVALVPVSDAKLAWVPKLTAAAYVVLAALSALDAFSRRRG